MNKKNLKILSLCFFLIITNVSVGYAQISIDKVAPDGEKPHFSRSVESSSLFAQDEAKQISKETQLKEKEILNPWKTKLPFELTLEKVRSFIIAGRAVDKNNKNWDALIAGAPTTEKAREYYLQATEESVLVIGEIPNITLDEYRALFELSLHDDDFAILLKALRQHIYPDEDYFIK